MAEKIKKITVKESWHEFVKEIKDIITNKLLMGKNIKKLVSSSLVINFLSLASPLVILQTYDRIIPNKAEGTLYILLVGVVIFIICEISLKIARSHMTNWTGAVFDHTTSKDAFGKILYTDLKEQESEHTADYMKKFAAIRKLRNFYSGEAMISLIDLPFTIIFLALTAYIGGTLVFVPIILISLFIIISLKMGTNLREAMLEQENTADPHTDFLFDSFQQQENIKILGVEKIFVRRSEYLQSNVGKSAIDVSFLSSFAQDTGYAFAQIMTILVVTFGAYKAVDGQIGIGTLAACNILANRAMTPIQKALSLWKRFQAFIISKKRLESLMGLEEAERKSAAFKIVPIGTLRVENLSVAHKHELDNPILENISFSLARGDSISIKTTGSAMNESIMNTLLGLTKAPKGNIYINNAHIDYFSTETKAEHIGHLASKGVIYRGSIWENLTFFGAVDKEDAMQASIRMGIDQAVLQLPKGYETLLKCNRSDPLSEGFKQRIAIARVLAHKPRVILYDNADSSLDKEGYNNLLVLLGRLKRKVSMVLISEDNNILMLANRNFVISDNKLLEAEQGHNILSTTSIQQYKNAS